MYSLLVIVALFSQIEVSEQLKDLAFTYQVEEFVYHTASAKDKVRINKNFSLLGSDVYLERVKATADLVNKLKNNSGEIHLLFWGRHNSDHEIAFRCNVVIRLLSTCDGCKGIGKYKATQYYETQCNYCGTMGYIWGLSAWE